MRLLSPQLQAFTAVTRLGTVHAAAQTLGFTQTAITQRIQALEEDLNASLFIRSRRGMQLTEAGQALAKYCREVEDLEGEALAQISGTGKEVVSKVIIEGPSSILRTRIIPALTTVFLRFPQLTVEFRMSDLTSGRLALKRGLGDIVIIPRSEVMEEFDSRLLKPERYILVGPVKWKGRKLEDIAAKERIVDFDPTDQMTFLWLEKYGLRQQCREDRFYVNNTDALSSMVMAGLGYSVLAREFAEVPIRDQQLCELGPGKFYDYEVALAWYPRKHPPGYWLELLKAIK